MTADELLALSARVGGRAEILDLRLQKFEFEVFLDNLAEPPYELQSSLQVHWNRHSEGDARGAFYFVEARASAAPPGGERVFEALVVHALAYAVGEDHTDEELQAFGQTSAVFACYPYVRELLQSATGRANLVPLILPVWRQFVPDAVGGTADESPAPAKKVGSKKAPAKKAAAKKARNSATL